METKVKKTRRVVGSFYKSKEGDRPPYLKLRDDVSFRKGDMVRVESKKFQLDSLDRAIAAGKLKEGEMVDQIRERINAIPDFVLGELVVLS